MSVALKLKRLDTKKWKAFEGLDRKFLAQVVTLKVCGDCSLVVTKDDSVYIIEEGLPAGEDENKKNTKKKKKKKKKRATKLELLCGRRVTGFVCGGGVQGDVLGGSGDATVAEAEDELPAVTTPRRMTVLDSWTQKRFYMALTEAGDIFTWGANNQGQLGRGGGGGGEDATPARILSLSQQTIVQAAAGTAHAIALTADGKVYGWGLNECGECGTDRRVVAHLAPTEVCFAATASAMDSNSGCSPHFQQMRLDRGEQPSTVVNAIACGASHSAAITSDGQVYCWGRNDRGQLGTGDREHRWRPTLVAELAQCVVTGITCGSVHTAAIVAQTEGGAKGVAVVSVWGDNTDGRLATNIKEKQDRKEIISLPTPVKRLHGIEAVFSSYDVAFTIAIKKCSTFIWGYISDKKILTKPKKKSKTLVQASYRMFITPCFTVR